MERKVEELRKEREKREKREVWRVWTGKVRERRRGEWEMGLRIGWEKVRGKWRERARRECFEVSLEEFPVGCAREGEDRELTCCVEINSIGNE